MKLIIEYERSEAWTAIPNSVLRDDARLTWKAKALLGYFLSCPPGWHINMTDLVSRAKDGESAVDSGITELQEAGYLSRSQDKDARGRWCSSTIRLHLPAIVSQKSPQPDFPVTDNPLPGFPVPENRPLNKTECNKTECNKTEEQDIGPSPFNLFLQKFPSEWNSQCGQTGNPKIRTANGEPPMLTPSRVSLARRAWKNSTSFRTEWLDAIWALTSLPSWCGSSKNQWRCDVDYFLKVGTVEKILEQADRSEQTAQFSRPADRAGAFKI